MWICGHCNRPTLGGGRRDGCVPPRVPSPGCRSSHLFQRQFQVADDVVPIFQADGEADALRVHSEGAFLLVGQGRVGHRERVLDERLDLPQADGQGDGIGVLGEVVHHAFRRAFAWRRLP